MYDYKDRAAAIKEIQRFLLVISETHTDIDHVTVDGVYGEETRSAVRCFQRMMGLDVTGTVDRETFDLIYLEYSRIALESSLEDKNFDLGAFPLKLGDSGSDVSVLNTTLNELAPYYKQIIITEGDFFGPDTEYSVKEMQKHFREEQSGSVDNRFLNLLKKELKIRQKFLDTK